MQTVPAASPQASNIASWLPKAKIVTRASPVWKTAFMPAERDQNLNNPVLARPGMKALALMQMCLSEQAGADGREGSASCRCLFVNRSREKLPKQMPCVRHDAHQGFEGLICRATGLYRAHLHEDSQSCI